MLQSDDAVIQHHVLIATFSPQINRPLITAQSETCEFRDQVALNWLNGPQSADCSSSCLHFLLSSSSFPSSTAEKEAQTSRVLLPVLLPKSRAACSALLCSALLVEVARVSRSKLDYSIIRSALLTVLFFPCVNSLAARHSCELRF